MYYKLRSFFTLIFAVFLIFSYVTAMNLCNACSSDGEVLRFVTVNKASIPQFRIFFRNIVVKYLFFFSFIPHKCCKRCRNTFSGPLSTVLACIPPFTRGQGAVTRRIGGRGHFRSRDENGGHTNSISHSRKPHAIRKLYGCIFYRTGVIAD